MLLGCAHLSKTDGSQSLDLQRDALTGGRCRRRGQPLPRLRLRPPRRPAGVSTRKGDVLVVVLESSPASAATSPIWSTSCRTCRPAGWVFAALAEFEGELIQMAFSASRSTAATASRCSCRAVSTAEASAPTYSRRVSPATSAGWLSRGMVGSGKQLADDDPCRWGAREARRRCRRRGWSRGR